MSAGASRRSSEAAGNGPLMIRMLAGENTRRLTAELLVEVTAARLATGGTGAANTVFQRADGSTCVKTNGTAHSAPRVTICIKRDTAIE